MKAADRTGPFWDIIEGRSPLSPVTRLLGWRLLALDADRGTIRVEYTAASEFINPIGTVQGGIITAMLDDAMGPVATAFLGGHHMAPTIEMKTNFLRPAMVGSLFVDACVVHRANNIIFLSGTMKDKDNRLIATASATARIFDWPTAVKNTPSTNS
jgi:uncharacterized protein (TIGR00369 family)